MKDQLIDRVLEEAHYIYNTHHTIRKTAQVFGLSKSTVHHDISTKLQHIDQSLYAKTKEILAENFAEKHIRGGRATKKKYECEKEKNGAR